MIREFHIDSFPEDKIWISFSKKFHKLIFDKINFNKINENYFNKKLNKDTFKQWKYRRHSIPLWFVLGTLSFLKKERLSMKQIEENIISYKGPGNSYPIENPKLPLKEDSRLIRIVTNLLCDGHAGGSAGTKSPEGYGSSIYRNFEPALLDKFEKVLMVFGKLKVDKNTKEGHIRFTNSIRYILEKVYDIKFGTFRGRIPKSFFTLDKNLAKEIVNAFGDDEGHVFDNHIEFYSKNKLLLKDLKNIIERVFLNLKLSKIKINNTCYPPKFYFYVLAESREDYAREIGFHHPIKLQDLEFNIKRMRMKKSYKPYVTKNKILTILSKEPLTAKNISRKIYIEHGTIIGHLNKLQKDGKIRIVGNGRYGAKIWKLSD